MCARGVESLVPGVCVRAWGGVGAEGRCVLPMRPTSTWESYEDFPKENKSYISKTAVEVAV